MNRILACVLAILGLGIASAAPKVEHALVTTTATTIRPQVRLASASFAFHLERPLDRERRFQGFGPDDVIYLLMPDRFANGDTALRTSPQEYVLVLLNRAGTDPVDLEVDDLRWPDGLTFRRFGGGPGATVSHGKLRIERPGEIEIHWARRP